MRSFKTSWKTSIKILLGVALPFFITSSIPFFYNLEHNQNPNEKEPQTYVLNIEYEQSTQETMDLLHVCMEFIKKKDMRASVSVTAKSLDDAEAALISEYASMNPGMIEVGLIDEDYLRGDIEKKIVAISKEQSGIAQDLANQSISPLLYPTSISSRVGNIDEKDINLLLQAGIKTILSPAEYKTSINSYDSSFTLIPVFRLDGKNKISQADRDIGIIALSLDLDDIVRNSGNSTSYALEALQFIFMQQENGSKVLRPVDVYFENGGRQNLIIRFDDLQYPLKQGEFIDIVLATYNALNIRNSRRDISSLNIAVIPYAAEDLNSNSVRESEQIIHFLRGYPFEIGLHGYSTEAPEFSRSAAEQEEIMIRYSNELENLFGREVYVLVPSLGKMNEDTLRIMAKTREKGDTNLRIISSYWPNDEISNLPIGTDSYLNYHPAPTIDPIDWNELDNEGYPRIHELERTLMMMGIYEGKSTQATTYVLNIHPLVHTNIEGIQYLQDLFNQLPEEILFTNFTNSPGYQSFWNIAEKLEEKKH